ncbi:MAG: ATP-binding cassette domain-containing protein [Bacteroidia bacterium]
MENVVVYLHDAKIYQQDALVLNNVNLNVSRGEFVYLTGKTGSGKSSLLKAIYGDLPLASGKGKVAGFDLTALNRRKTAFLRRKLGIVFQDFQLLTDRSVADNLTFVLKATGWKRKDLIEKRLQEVLNLVGLGTKHFKMPYALSGGEQQRVVIARALLNDPQVILADEPTGNLDPEISDEILRLLKKISEDGTAVIMASHDYRIMEKYPSRTLKVNDGHILELN